MGTDTSGLRWLEELYPGYFTLTMATGIISIGLGLLEASALSSLMYWLTLISWLTLFGLYAARLALFPKAVWADLMNPRQTFNFFSLVAATSICGLLLHLHGHYNLALLCWAVAFFAWLALLYYSFGVLALLHGERNINIVDGGWLICIVGTQSLVLLGLKIIPQLGSYDTVIMLLIFMLWGLGLILYGIFVTLFCYRVFFLEMKLDDYTPQMWVIMGAAAISANASSSLDMAPPILTVLYEVHPVIDSMALITWAWASWWIPLLTVVSFWKHVIKKVPVGYDPRQWSIVFPLGMYTVASVQLSLAAEFDPLHWISHIMVWVAVAMWGLLIIAVLRRVAAGLFTRATPGPESTRERRS
ncbi:MAG: tellurite resistance/C4-dicarboxylate transporter family protein [Thermodesulfobacteriota bacterium]